MRKYWTGFCGPWKPWTGFGRARRIAHLGRAHCSEVLLVKMLASRLLARPGLVPCSRQTAHAVRLGAAPASLLLDRSRRVFTSTPRHRKDDARARTIQQEVERKPAAEESIKPESIKAEEKPAEPAATSSKNDPLLAEQTVSNKEQRKADWAIIKDMAQYLWPKNDFSTRFRVGLSVGLLVGAKVGCYLSPHISRDSCVDSFSAYVGPQCASALLLQVHRGFHEH